MVFEPDATTTEEQSNSTSTSGELSTLDVLERLSTMFTPFVQLLTVIVQGLTAYTLLRQI